MQPMLLEGKIYLKDSVFKLRTYYIDESYSEKKMHYDTVYVK